MFSIRQTLGGGRHWTRAFLVQFSADLSEAGFTQLTVKLPVDLANLLKDEIPVQQRIDEHLKDREIPLKEFLDRERNYAACILVAINPEAQETLKALFVNLSRKTSFMDNTFPSGDSVPKTQLYVQSPDPGRAYSLFHFFYHYLKQSGAPTAPLAIAGILSVFLTAAQAIALISSRSGILHAVWGLSHAFDIVAVVLLLLIQYWFFMAPTGLSVNDRATASPGFFLRRAIRGEFKDNPIATVVLSVIASIIAAFILRLIGFL